jgi:hypothetical protein
MQHPAQTRLSTLLSLVLVLMIATLGSVRAQSVTGDAERQIVITIREASTPLATAAGSTPKAYGDPGRYRPSNYVRRLTNQIAREYGLTWIADWRIQVLNVHCVVLGAPNIEARSEALRRLRNDPRIESAQPMHEFHTAANTTYNDPYFPLQKSVEAMRVPEAQHWSQGRGVRLAVIDTGVDTNHPDLAGRVRVSRNFVDKDTKTFQGDAHGTAVAGIIGAAINNGVGIVGVAPEVELMALKACWHRSVSAPAVCNTLTLAEALAFAIAKNAAIINLSLTGPNDPLLKRLVDIALARGTIVIGADAQRSGTDSAFPVSIDGVLAVIDADANVDSAELAAPGREILTLVPAGHYDYLSGVSLSSAMVSGIVALLLERDRKLTAAQIRALLERTASPTTMNAADTGTARAPKKIVDACRAVAEIVRREDCVDTAHRADVAPRRTHAAERSTAADSADRSEGSRRRPVPRPVAAEIPPG